MNKSTMMAIMIVFIESTCLFASYNKFGSISPIAEDFVKLDIQESINKQSRIVNYAYSLESENSNNLGSISEFEKKKQMTIFAVSQGLDWSIVKSAMQNALLNQSEEVKVQFLGEVNKLILEVPYWKKVEKTTAKDGSLNASDRAKLAQKLETCDLYKEIWRDYNGNNSAQKALEESDPFNLLIKMDLNQKLYSHIVSKSNVTPDFYKNLNTPIFDIDSQRK
ncbi:MAG: hypothetical protein JO129_02975 [Candidatus Dependentiae bacterium]|nr:hypothetical protein [Candidatus Dependentiae bacterium]